MMINSENQLLSIDESCLSDLSDENQSTISGGTLGLLVALLSWCAPKKYVAPCPPPKPVCPPPPPVCEPPKPTSCY
ncbi:hypothetical protein NIES2100_71830 [Calothrix sp. NIES-2100]|uniref:hypothetical protein n=1 Tax=Calothrix sp. NIES-2100 TaxID=1954172 RepID=UPI000B5EE976|nr:hypothetical protein NIES2100_71830 [Calothrix sp. NIES-2100]